MRSLKLFVDAKTGKRFYAHTIKELRSQIGNGGSKVNKMYVDKDGHTYHIGYVIGPYWLEMYEPVMRYKYEPLRKEVKV